MRIADHLRLGKCRTKYHRALVDDCFFDALGHLLDDTISAQLQEPLLSATGTVTPTYNHKRHCGPISLVRDIFTVDARFQSESGETTLKADVMYDLSSQSFRPRNDYDYYFWTPERQEKHKDNISKIEQYIDRIKRDVDATHRCPICDGMLSVTDSTKLFNVRCVDSDCFVYNYHRDEKGRILHGHFFPSRPE